MQENWRTLYLRRANPTLYTFIFSPILGLEVFCTFDILISSFSCIKCAISIMMSWNLFEIRPLALLIPLFWNQTLCFICFKWVFVKCKLWYSSFFVLLLNNFMKALKKKSLILMKMYKGSWGKQFIYINKKSWAFPSFC